MQETEGVRDGGGREGDRERGRRSWDGTTEIGGEEFIRRRREELNAKIPPDHNGGVKTKRRNPE